jgi:transcriptional regulator with XRE-family HTH domain
MTQTTWTDGLQERIARAVKAARGKRSAQDIADETARLGYPITRAQIANLESGRRRGLDVSELLILAAALDVPPVTLLYPGLPDDEVEVLPDQFISSIAALLRFTGEAETPRSDLARLAKLSRELFHKRIRHELAIDVLQELADASDDASAVKQIENVINEAEEIKDYEQRIAEIPGSTLDA